MKEELERATRDRLEARDLGVRMVRVRTTSARNLLFLLDAAQELSPRKGGWVSATEVGRIAAMNDLPFWGSWLRKLALRGLVEHKKVSLFRISDKGRLVISL